MTPRKDSGEESVDDLLTESAALIKDDFPTKAVDALRRARAAAIKKVNSSGNVDPAGESGVVARKAALQAVDSDPRAAAALECEKELVALLEDVVDETKWRTHGTRYGVTCQMERPDPNGPTSKLLRFRIEMVLDTDLFSCMATMNETEDFKLWIPGVDQSSVLHETSLFRRIIRCSGKKPWPLPRDEVLTAAYGDTCRASDFLGPSDAGGVGLGCGVAIYMRPAGPEWPRTPGCKVVDLTGGYWFEAVGPNKTRVLQVATVDSHLLLPNWLVNWIIANIAYLMLPMLFKQSKHYAPGGKLHDRISSKPEMYGEIRRRLEQLEAENADSSSASSKSYETSTAGVDIANAAHPSGAVDGRTRDSGSKQGRRIRGTTRTQILKISSNISIATHTPALMRPLKGLWLLWTIVCAVAAVFAARSVAQGQLAQSGAGLGVCFASSSALVGPGGAAVLHCATLVAVACLGN